MSQDIVRRFEIQGVRPAVLDTIERILRKPTPRNGVVASVSKVTNPPLLQVRLEGAAALVASLKARVEGMAGVQVFNDVLEARPGPGGTAGYPDANAALRVDEAQSISLNPVKHKGAARVTVAIVDSGVMTDHVDLRKNLWEGTLGGQRVHGVRCIDGKVEPDETDEDGHGTMLAGTILATAKADPNVRLMPVKFFTGGSRPSPQDAAAGIDFAVRYGADIICLSWEIGIESDHVQAAVRRAVEADKLIVFAAGNGGSDNDSAPSTPSRYASESRERTITVMATTRYDPKAWFSNYGDQTVDVAAPGIDVVSTFPYLSKAAETAAGQALRYRVYSGTSAAAAVVTGAAALLKARYPALTAEKIKRYLMETVDVRPGLGCVDRPGLRCLSQGRINLAAAVKLAGAPSKRQPGKPANRRSRASRSRRSGSRMAYRSTKRPTSKAGSTASRA